MFKVIYKLMFFDLAVKIRDIGSTLKHRIFHNNFSQFFGSKNIRRKILFSLDLHTSVVRDFTPLIKDFNVNVIRWSISGSSRLFNEPNLKLKIINSSTWKDLNMPMINKFQKKYSRFLEKQDGFILSYTFSFVDIFKKYGKPILGINATRYESPYTFKMNSFLDLNASLQNYQNLYLISNNIGDKDYLKYFTGLESQYIPSLCDYTVQNKPENDKWIIQCRNHDLAVNIASINRNIEPSFKIWPNGYSYKQLSIVKGIILIPYNISTMGMFELTTAGFPIRIPSDRLLIQLSSMPGVLSELSYAQVHQRKVLQMNENSPMDPTWDKFYNWWLERADWNNTDYFPNVSRFDSFEELDFDPKPFKMETIFDRNAKIYELWKTSLARFTNLL
jgi:hypothetical protein